jgi:hypothetical protein
MSSTESPPERPLQAYFILPWISLVQLSPASDGEPDVLAKFVMLPKPAYGFVVGLNLSQKLPFG